MGSSLQPLDQLFVPIHSMLIQFKEHIRLILWFNEQLHWMIQIIDQAEVLDVLAIHLEQLSTRRHSMLP